jgi:hypothetical protein
MAVTVGEGAASFTVTRGRDRKVPVSMKVDLAYESTLLDFHIHNEAELRRIGAAGNGLPIDDTRTYYLENDIVLEQPWAPIGDGSTPFEAIFDGQGHTVTIQSFDTSANPQYVGFFGHVDGAEVVKDMTILYNGPLVDMTYSANPYIGLVAGYAKDTIFRDIRVRGNLSANSTITTGNTFYIGGVAGYGDSLTVDNCHVSGNVSGEAGSIDLLIGGIAGSIGSTSSSPSAIANTSFTGKAGGESDKNCKAGGIAGYIGAGGGSVTLSYASANVEAKGADAYAGGIAGEINTTTSVSMKIETCYAWANVKATGNTATTANAAAGGIAGRVENSGNAIEICYARGTVKAATGTGTVTEYAGGIVGDNDYGDIRRCAALHSSIIAANRCNRIAGRFSYGAIGSNRVRSDTACSATGSLFGDADGGPAAHSLPETDFQGPPAGPMYGSAPACLNWTFDSSNWTWINGYPALYWQNSPPRDPDTLL